MEMLLNPIINRLWIAFDCDLKSILESNVNLTLELANCPQHQHLFMQRKPIILIRICCEKNGSREGDHQPAEICFRAINENPLMSKLNARKGWRGRTLDLAFLEAVESLPYRLFPRRSSSACENSKSFINQFRCGCVIPLFNFMLRLRILLEESHTIDRTENWQQIPPIP
jgi:hypothetical protein